MFGKILFLGKSIQKSCNTRARDALHIASAIIGQSRYCLSCDSTVTNMKHAIGALENLSDKCIFQ
jgi:hypothetical protein